MSKTTQPMPNQIFIRHFEDEPQRVDLPELIEMALYQTDGVTNCKIEFAEERDRYNITFSRGDMDWHLIYVVGETLERIDSALASSEGTKLLLDIVDMSIGSNRSAGIGIVGELIGFGINQQNIWMLTAYFVEARTHCNEKEWKVRIISKPPNHRMIRDDIIEKILLITDSSPKNGGSDG